MYNFQYANPTRVCFGEGQIARLPELIPAGSRLLVLYGGGSIKRNGVYEQLTQALAGREWLEFPRHRRQPQYDQLMEAVALVKREARIDFLGGRVVVPVVDGNKFVAAAACFEGRTPGRSCCTRPRQAALPLGCDADPAGYRFGKQPGRGGEPGRPSSPSWPAGAAGVCGAGSRHHLQPAAAPVGNGVVDAFVHIIEQYLPPSRWGRRCRTGWRKGCCRCWWTTARRCWRSPPTTRCAQPDVGGQPGAQRPHRARRAAGLVHPPSRSPAHRVAGWIMPTWRWCCPRCCASRPSQKQGELAQFAEQGYGTPAARTGRCASGAIIRTEQFFQQQMGWAPASSSTTAWMRASRGSAPTSVGPREQRDIDPDKVARIFPTV